MSKNYKKYSQANGDPIQVDSAIRDGNGKNIADNYAKQNGYYSGLTSGLAVNIKTDKGATVTDAVARLDPISVSVEDGDFASMTNFKGRSFAYNQLVKNGDFATDTNWGVNGATYTITNNKIAITVNITSSQAVSIAQNKTLIGGHKHLIAYNLKPSVSGYTRVWFNNEMSELQSTIANTNTRHFTIFTPTSTATSSLLFYLNRDGNNIGDTGEYSNIIVFDLTAMGINTTDVTEAIAALRSYNIDPSVYNEYSPGKIIDSQPNKIISRRLNQWDEQWEVGTYFPNTINTKNPISLISGLTYYLKAPSDMLIIFYDSNMTMIGDEQRWYANATKVIPDNAKYMTFRMTSTYGTTYNHDICINISNTALNGTYKPYVANEYTITAPVMRSAGSVADDKDNVKVGTIDLGSLNYVQFGSNAHTFFSESIDDIKLPDYTSIPNAKCARYITINDYDLNAGSINGIGVHNVQNKIIITDLNYDATTAEGRTAFKTAMSGVMLNFELATPTPQTGLVLPTNIVTYNGGTLETQYTSPNTTPGLVSMLYQVNLKNFIEGIGTREDINFQPGEIVSKTELEQGLEQTYGDVKDDLEKGNLIPALSENLTPYSDESGNLQTIPFVMQGTGCGNGENVIDTGSFAQLKEKRGNSVVVNQIVSTLVATKTVNDVTFTNNGDGSITLNGTASAEIGTNSLGEYLTGSGIYFPRRNHKVLVTCNNSKEGFYFGVGGYSINKTNAFIFNESNTSDWSNGVTCHILAGTTFNNFKIVPKVIDLTQWFGSNDNIPAHLLSHPEDFGRYYSGSLAYNAGTIVNSNARYLKTIGRNQWDEETINASLNENTGVFTPSASAPISSKNFISIIPNTIYYFKKPSGITTIWIAYYDSNKNFISASAIQSGVNTFTTQSNCGYIKFQTVNYSTYNNDITISIYYEDESGYNQYYPYEELDNVDTGTEVLRSAGSVYDVKKPSGEITRVVGSCKLKELNWNYTTSTRIFYATIEGIKNTTSNLRCNNYSYGPISGTGNDADKLYYVYLTTLYITDSNYTTSESFKNHFTDDNYLYFELITPTTEQGISFQENIKIDDFGSMKWDNESFNGVPQGNAIFYPVDYKAFLDSLNNYTDGDVNNLATTTGLTAETTARTSQDTILLNAIGGILRQCLCVKESLDFNNTNFVDLGSLTWSYANGLFSASKPSDAVLNTTDSVATNILCSNYKTVARDYVYTNDKSIGMKYEILIRDTSYTDTTAFKNAMKGVLLAYEKA